uniref:Uncharacterized protein n=1 Tax=Anguilla anguilla TaxID=7936 RepID=A0A0E9WTP3_ANGAN
MLGTIPRRHFKLILAFLLATVKLILNITALAHTERDSVFEGEDVFACVTPVFSKASPALLLGGKAL